MFDKFFIGIVSALLALYLNRLPLRDYYETIKACSQKYVK